MTRTFRTVATFALLVAGYFGYVHLFAIVAERAHPPSPIPGAEYRLRPSASAGAREAADLALRVFGEHHWTGGAVSDVTKYYNVERGYWMYWSSFEFPDEHDRKRIILAPFAVIWGSNKDGSTKVMSGDRAIIDFDQPFNLMGGGPKANVVHAKIEGIDEHVLILDDKGTPEPADDLVITVPYAEYFEKQMQIRCDDLVQLVEGDVTVRGRGLVIALRPAEASGGFPGAEVVTLNDHVVITSEDVGSTGILPGSATPSQQVAAAATDPGDDAAPVPAPKTPVKLTSDGPMRMQLPKPRLPAPVGPPAPAQPTIAEFSRNVVIERGVDQPDRITGDHLHAVLIPKDPPVGPDGEDLPAPDDANGPGGGLRLLEARVDGHAVWLESLSERVRVRGNELIYRKPEQEAPEVTYFRADPGQQVEFERTEVDEQGGLKSLVTIWSADATLHGDPERQGRSTVIARGPGLLEMRPGRDAPVERSATWRDEMIVETSLAASDPAQEGTRTFITLLGWPVMDDPKQLTLAAREKVVISLLPRSDAPPAGAAPTSSEAGGAKARSYQVEWVSALGDVHMVTPEGVDGPATGVATAGPSKPRRELNARERLDVVFTYLDDPSPAGTIAGTPGATGPRTVLASRPGVAVDPAGAADLAAPAASTSPPGGPDSPGDSSRSTVVAETDTTAADPPFSAEADLVWARIEVVGDGQGLDLDGGSGGKREVREARLRRDVVIHQDPAPGKETGFHVDADYGVDLQNVGPGRLKLYAHGERRPVTVASDDFYIQGFPDARADDKVVLGVDQAFDYAFVQGPGRLWNLTNQNRMGRIDLASDRREEAPDGGREPLIVTWDEAMFFHGRFAEPDGSPGPARALFLGDVRARHGDSGSKSQEMEAIFDRSISFDRSIPGQGGGRPQDEGRVQIDSVICNGGVELWSLVRDADNPAAVRELREAFGESVTFDRPGDHFWIDGAGRVTVATLEDGKGGGGDAFRVIPTAYQAGRSVADAPPRSAPRPRPRLSKVKIDFNDGVEGQLGSAGGGYRAAEFRGDARAIRAQVAQFRDLLDFDRPPADAVLLDGDSIYVEHNPAVPGIPDRNFLKAVGTAQARSEGKTLLGDTITYDSNTGLFFVLGSAATPVTIASQELHGQPTSRSFARAVRYNAKTDESEAIEPGSAIFFRPNTGYRAGLAKPRDPWVEQERDRPKPRLPARNDMERQGFTGQ